MLHGILKELGNCLDVRDEISEKGFFHIFSINFQPIVPCCLDL